MSAAKSGAAAAAAAGDGSGSETDDDVSIVSSTPGPSASQTRTAASSAAAAGGGGGSKPSIDSKGSTAAVGTDLDPETEWEIAAAGFRELLEPDSRTLSAFLKLMDHTRRLIAMTRSAARSGPPPSAGSTPNGRSAASSSSSSSASASSSSSPWNAAASPSAPAVADFGRPLFTIPEVVSVLPRGKWRVTMYASTLTFTSVTSAAAKKSAGIPAIPAPAKGIDDIDIAAGLNADDDEPAPSTPAKKSAPSAAAAASPSGPIAIPLSHITRLIVVPVPPSSSTISIVAPKQPTEHFVVLSLSGDGVVMGGKLPQRMLVFQFTDPKIPANSTSTVSTKGSKGVIWHYISEMKKATEENATPASSSSSSSSSSAASEPHRPAIPSVVTKVCETIHAAYTTAAAPVDRKHGVGFNKLLANAMANAIAQIAGVQPRARKGGSALKVETCDRRLFASADGSGCLHCSFKANQGFVFPLTDGMLFLKKPALYVAFDDIVGLSMGRATGAVGHTFDLSVTLADSLSSSTNSSVKLKDGDELQFCMIPKADEPRLGAYLAAFKKRRIRENAEVDAKNSAGADGDDGSTAAAVGGGGGGGDGKRRSKTSLAAAAGGGDPSLIDSDADDDDYQPDGSAEDGMDHVIPRSQDGEASSGGDGGDESADDISDGDGSHAAAKPKSKSAKSKSNANGKPKSAARKRKANADADFVVGSDEELSGDSDGADGGSGDEDEFSDMERGDDDDPDDIGGHNPKRRKKKKKPKKSVERKPKKAGGSGGDSKSKSKSAKAKPAATRNAAGPADDDDDWETAPLEALSAGGGGGGAAASHFRAVPSSPPPLVTTPAIAGAAKNKVAIKTTAAEAIAIDDD